MANTCEIANGIVDHFKKFKLANKPNGAIILKIDKAALQVVMDQDLENVSMDDIRETLPESAPRYITYSDINPSLAMLYTSTKVKLLNALQVQKSFDVQDSSVLTEQWLIEKLKFFK